MDDGAAGAVPALAAASARQRLEAALADNADALRDLQASYDDIVAASRDSNADDEHDPEGATIAFERQQVVALLDGARAAGGQLEAALAAVDEGSYGICAQCGAPIGAERLEARPGARICVACASTRR